MTGVQTCALPICLAGVQPTERLPDSAYRREMSKAVYDRLLELAATVVGGGHSAIVDAVFLDHGERSAIEDVARRAGVPFSGMWLELPLEERARRVGTRSRDASDATVEVARRQEELDPGPMAWSRVSAAGSLEAVAARVQALTHLNAASQIG